MANNSEKIKEYLGITKWHNAGYTGKGVSILSMEQVKSQRKFPYVTAVNGFGDDDGGHGSKVMEQMKEIAPDATFYTCSKKGNTENWKPLYLDFIYRNKIALVASSKLSTQNKVSTTVERYMQECIDNGTTFFIGAGNQTVLGGREIYAEAKSDKYLAIGACEFENGNVWKANYSCEGDELDFMTIVGYGKESGTSYAENRFCAMCALVQQFFLEKVGRTLYRSELVAFIMDNIKDLREKGFDKYTGYGLFILPELESIDVYKYITHNEGCDYGGFPEVRSDIGMRGIDKLHPELQVCVNKFLEECKKQGLNVLITETLRTQEEQEKLYAKGRTQPGKIVTNCRGYQSPHCWGVAFDFCRNVKGKEYDNTDGFFERVGSIAKELFKDTEYRLFWGGDFKTFVDKPHIEMVKYMPNNSTKWLVNTYGTPEKFMETWSKGDGDNMGEKVSDWAETAWNWCKEKGYLDGSNPKGTVTREMLAQVLYNLFAKGGNK